MSSGRIALRFDGDEGVKRNVALIAGGAGGSIGVEEAENGRSLVAWAVDLRWRWEIGVRHLVWWSLCGGEGSE